MNDEDYLDIYEIHKASLDLLKFIHDFCKKNNLTYYLAYGTLLGCIRHGGYIPWDDDIDIWMPRSSYDRMIDLFYQSQYKIGDYSLLSRDSSKKCDYSILRVTDMKYKLVQSNSNLYPDMGTFVDIYPLDNIESKHSFKKVYNRFKRLNWLYTVYLTWDSPSKIKAIIKFFIHYFLRIRYGNNYLKVVNNKSNKLLQCYSKNNYENYAVLNWFTTGETIYSKQLFSDVNSMKFENLMLNVPSGYHELLSLIYGDYMTPPDSNNRLAYHNYKIFRRRENEGANS